MSFFGADPSAIIGHIAGAIGSLAPAPAPQASFAPGQGPGQGGFAPAPMVAGSNAWPTVTIGGGGFQPAQMQGGAFQPSGGLAGGFQPSGGLGGGFQPSGGIGGSPFQPSAQNPLLAPPKPPTTSGATTPGSGGANYAGPTSAADNAGLTGQQIDQYIAKTRPGSPLAGEGQFILDEANRQGVSVPQLIGIMTLESGLGTEQGTLPGVFNYGGLTGSGWAGQTGNTTGMARAFATFGSKEAGIAALISNLASPLYKGKTLQQQIATWYLGDPNAALNSSDENQNATLQQYLDVINGAYQGLGVGAKPQGGASIPAGPALQTIFGGQSPPSIMQEFGQTDYSTSHESTYTYGTAYGLPPGSHPGVDYGMARGTSLYVPVDGVVVYGGGTGYYTDNNGDGPGHGELLIQLANGDQIIMGHMSQINLQPGQHVTAGMLAGLSGGSDGDHLHLEVRQVDHSLPSGYRIVDPRGYFGQR
jgi:murein DD-endopeptidase MepM/ murein hydrolase activator NlpD